MNCPICDMELEMDEKGDGRCDYHRYLSYFTAKDLAQAAVLRARLIAEAVKPLEEALVKAHEALTAAEQVIIKTINEGQHE